MKRYLSFLVVLFIVLGLACRPDRDYDQIVSRELATGVRHDSLFLGLYFAMPRDSFYRHCWQLNQQGLVTNGPRNTTVLYTVPGKTQPIEVNFYPAFAEGKIYRLDVTFNYQAWAPWNRPLFSDKLLPEALGLLEHWFAASFEKFKTPDGKPFWADVSGNRAIQVTLADERDVRVDIRDLTTNPPAPDPPPSAGDLRPKWDKK